VGFNPSLTSLLVHELFEVCHSG